MGLSLRSGLDNELEDNTEQAGIEKSLRMIKVYSQAHNEQIGKLLFSSEFSNDIAIKLISPIHDKRTFMDMSIGDVDIRG